MVRHRKYYDIYPKVVQTGVPTGITLSAKNKAKAFTGEAYYLAFIPAGHQNIGFCRQWPEIDQILVQPENGALKFTYTFALEQEYHIWVYAATEADRGNKKPIVQIYRIMKVPQISSVKPSLQNCKNQEKLDRVGIKRITRNGLEVITSKPRFSTKKTQMLYRCGLRQSSTNWIFPLSLSDMISCCRYRGCQIS